MRPISKHWQSYFLVIFSILLILTGCNFPAPAYEGLQGVRDHSTTSGRVDITFRLKVTQPLQDGESIYLSILDEVTGLSFYPEKYRLTAENAETYIVTIPAELGAVIKYRYSREGTQQILESVSPGRPVRYRLYHVESPAIVNDLVNNWTDSEANLPHGRIIGQILDSSTGLGVPGILVSAGGKQTFSLADGSFQLDELPIGLHTLVFYPINGSYDIYQQLAFVAENSTTPAIVSLNPSRMATVIFTVTVPPDTPPDAPLRLAGNLYQLGNNFSDLSGGTSTISSRMPLLGKLPDGRYMVTISLPVNSYIEYKYTLGDGLWSSELDANDTPRIRRLIVPDGNSTVNDSVKAWHNNKTETISFEVKVPLTIPNRERVSIQFNPGTGWTEPLPMQPTINSLGENIWRFYLTGPFKDLKSIRYRYCRQEQCGIADDATTMGPNSLGRTINLSGGTVMDNVTAWAWMGTQSYTPVIVDQEVIPRGDRFIAGVSFQSDYRPSWDATFEQTLTVLKALKINQLIFTPTWTFSGSDKPNLEQIPPEDMSWFELNRELTLAQQQGMRTSLYPTPNFPLNQNQWWSSASLDYSWWQIFFDEYSEFILHNAILASNTTSDSLILGGTWLTPALPGGTLENGKTSAVPQDADERWRALIQHVRHHYEGKITWALKYPDGVINPPSFIDSVDEIFIIWSAPIAQDDDVSIEVMQARASEILRQEIFPFQQKYAKPIIIAISYPSISWGAMGCIHLLGGGCLDYAYLNPSFPDIAELGLSIKVQANAYQAVLGAIDEHPWISGVLSMGYYPPAVLQDKSISINGKPASGVFWYWSQKFLGD